MGSRNMKYLITLFKNLIYTHYILDTSLPQKAVKTTDSTRVMNLQAALTLLPNKHLTIYLFTYYLNVPVHITRDMTLRRGHKKKGKNA